jgi:L-fucose isomerase-like protein
LEKTLVTFFSPISDEINNSQLREKCKQGGWNTILPSELELMSQVLENNVVWLFIGTGGTERSVIDYLQQFLKDSNNILPLIITHDHYNSLPAGMEIRRYLEEKKVPAKIIHVDMERIHKNLDQELFVQNVRRKLRKFRLGLIGEVSEWLIASQIDPQSVRNVWGIELVSIPISELLESISTYRNEKLAQTTQEFFIQAEVTDRSKNQIHEAQYVVHAIKDLIRRYSLNAFSIECFSLIQETDSTSCYALSYFNDIGLVAGCEGDLPSTFTMVLVNLLLDQPSFMANVVSVNQEENTVNLAHCTVPLSMTERYMIRSHFESNKGVAIKGEFKENEPITLIKIGGSSLTDWWVSSGTIIRNPDDEGCCRTQVEVQLKDSVIYFLQNSLANHHIMVLGDHQTIFENFLKQISG